MYSFGMVVHELLQPKYKYPWESVYDGARPETINILIVEAVKRGERPPVPAFKELTYRGAVDIMKECWVQNPEKRPTAKEVQNKLLILVYTLLHYYNYLCTNLVNMQEGQIQQDENEEQRNWESSRNDSSVTLTVQTTKASNWVGAKESPLKKTFLSQQKNQFENPAKKVVDFSPEKVIQRD